MSLLNNESIYPIFLIGRSENLLNEIADYFLDMNLVHRVSQIIQKPDLKYLN